MDDTKGMKKLYKSSEDKKLFGVCGGIAEYFNVDSTLVRIGFLILCLPGGFPGILAYFAMVIIVPDKASA